MRRERRWPSCSSGPTPEDHLSLYLDGGEAILGALQLVAQEQPSGHLDRILAARQQHRSTLTAGSMLLTTREAEVLAYLPPRLSNAEIASALYLSPNTVKTHVKHIYQKLDATGRNDAVRLAREQGLL